MPRSREVGKARFVAALRAGHQLSSLSFSDGRATVRQPFGIIVHDRCRGRDHCPRSTRSRLRTVPKRIRRLRGGVAVAAARVNRSSQPCG